jgi:hypothetical protein
MGLMWQARPYASRKLAVTMGLREIDGFIV